MNDRERERKRENKKNKIKNSVMQSVSLFSMLLIIKNRLIHT